jgi:hypothetical protein
MIRIQHASFIWSNSKFDDSVIYKEENVYGDRTIEEYMKIMLKSTFRVRKSQRKIRNFEQDMWNLILILKLLKLSPYWWEFFLFKDVL